MITEALLIAAAGWGCTAMLSYEKGPFNIFVKIRQLIGIQHDDQGQPTVWSDNVLANAVSCPWCLGIYGAVAMWGLWQVSQTAVMILAASAGLVIIEQWARRG